MPSGTSHADPGIADSGKVHTPRSQNVITTAKVLAAARAYFVPPKLLTNPPPAVTDLRAYAHHGTWTRADGLARTVGVAWLYAVALPVTVACRYLEWVAQRPGRAVVVLGLWLAFIKTGGGPWIADNLIRPLIDVAAAVLL